MLQKFKRFIAENNLVEPGDKILLAVSGGIDSMVMTHLFLQLEYYSFGIAHCNFTLRSTESDLDEKLVTNYASEHNVAFYTTRFDTKAYAKSKGLSIQMAARELRYEWFAKIRKDEGFDSIALAHNLNDNIETLIINLIRGTGIAGLTGMKPVVNGLIRPLLFATREEITAYCKKNGIIYREDKSNADTKYTRNKIRHLVIPVLREINPSAEYTLNETTERLSGINEIVTEYIAGVRKSISTEDDRFVSFDLDLLKPYLNNKAIVFELFKPFGINNIPLNDLLNIIEGETGGQVYTGTHRIVKNRSEIIVSSPADNEVTVTIIENISELESVPGIDVVALETISDKFEIPSEPCSACIDHDKLVFPLIIRKWKTGDYFFPLGMKHKKKLSDYFVDNKYSVIEKENVRILESDGKIVWIIDDRLDDRFRITGSTKKALILSFRKTI